MAQSRQISVEKLFGLACVFLLLLGSVIQATHIHPADSLSTSHNCAVCAVAASAMDAPAIAQAEPETQVSEQIQLVENTPQSRFISFSLKIRPPPSA